MEAHPQLLLLVSGQQKLWWNESPNKEAHPWLLLPIDKQQKPWGVILHLRMLARSFCSPSVSSRRPMGLAHFSCPSAVGRKGRGSKLPHKEAGLPLLPIGGRKSRWGAGDQASGLGEEVAAWLGEWGNMHRFLQEERKERG